MVEMVMIVGNDHNDHNDPNEHNDHNGHNDHNDLNHPNEHAASPLRFRMRLLQET